MKIFVLRLIRSNRVLVAWTEVCHQIFCCWEVQTMWNLLNNIWCEAYFCQKMFANWLNMGFPLQTWVKTHQLSSKIKVPGAAVSKEGHAASLLGQERTHHYWFPWKKFNSASYCKHDSKKKFWEQEQWSVKKVMLPVFLDMNRHNFIDFLEKSSTVLPIANMIPKKSSGNRNNGQKRRSCWQSSWIWKDLSLLILLKLV